MKKIIPNHKRWTIRKTIVLFFMLVILFITYPRLYPLYGSVAGALFVIPIVYVGWYLGTIDGIVGAILIISFLYFIQPSRTTVQAFVFELFPGLIIGILSGTAAGWISDLFHKTKQQSIELSKKNTALNHEITQRKKAEQAINQLNQDLEFRILQRTNDLEKTNAELLAEIETRKTTEEKLISSLSEKSTLLKEVHHRVKNNLQIISSLLNLASAKITDQESLVVFKESQNRVHSMALIHENLYRSDDLAHINFKTYINTITNHLIQSYQKGLADISFRIEGEEIFLPIDTAIPCGLILNELISNALKYATSDKKEVDIGVLFKKTQPDEILMQIHDNGPGLNFDIQSPPGNSLGLSLVNTLVLQLSARLEVNNQTGACFSIYIPI